MKKKMLMPAMGNEDDDDVRSEKNARVIQSV